MKVLLYLLIPFLVTSCATAPSNRLKPVVLAGVFTVRACPTAEYYSDSYATLLLDSPISVLGLGQVDSVELVLDEPYFVHYQTYLNKHGLVTCTSVSASMLCGPTSSRAYCGVTHIKVAP